MSERIPVKLMAQLTVVVIVVLLGLVGWFIRYPATSGYTYYDVDLPQGFELSVAEQALVSEGYSVEANYAPEYGQDPYLRTTGSRNSEGHTILIIHLEERDDNVNVFATRKILIRPFEVMQDLHAFARIQHKVTEEDIRNLLETVSLPSDGTFTFVEEVDSLDYMIPTTAFYFLLFVHFPGVVIMVVLMVVFREYKRIYQQSQEPPPPNRVG
jgi:hypothetical protein